MAPSEIDRPVRADSLLDFFMVCGHLKTNKRNGWIRKNVQLPESIADHMYSTCDCATLGSISVL